MYLGGPELTFAATGEIVDAESLGGAKCIAASVASPTISPKMTATRWPSRVRSCATWVNNPNRWTRQPSAAAVRSA